MTGRGYFVAAGALAASLWLAAAHAEVGISNAWVQETRPGQSVASAYMELKSSEAAKLIKVESPAAQSAEIHSMRMESGAMKMRAVKELDLPAGQIVKLGATGQHLMLNDIRQPLKAGDKVPLTLTVQSKGKAPETIKVEVEVRSGKHEHGHDHH